MTQGHEASKCCWKNDSNRLACCRVAKSFQLMKNTIRASLVVQWLGIPVVKPANVGDTSLIPSRKIPRASGQLSPCATTPEAATREATTMRSLHTVSRERPCTPGRPNTAKKQTKQHNEAKCRKNEVCLYRIITQSIIQLLSCVQLFETPRTAACQASLSFTVSEFAQIHVH